MCNKMLPMIRLWYQVNPFGMLARLGHANGQFVKNVISICNIPIARKEFYGFCNSCCVGKSLRLHTPLSITIHSKLFEVIHTKLRSPTPETSHFGYTFAYSL